MKEGDVVGLQLEFERQTLTVYLNGSRRGVMASPGMKSCDGAPVAPLVSPLRWAVDIGDGGSVRIERKRPPCTAHQEERCELQ